MKKIYFILGLLNIAFMAMFVLYYIDAINPAIDNRIIIEFVDGKLLANIPDFIKNNYVYSSIYNFIKDIEQMNRMYAFAGWAFFLLVNIITFIRIVMRTVKDYLACFIRLFFSPITALIGFYINSQKNDKKAVMYESEDKDTEYDEKDNTESEPVLKEDNSKIRKKQTERVMLLLPDKPIISGVIVAIISCGIVAAMVGLFFYIKRSINIRIPGAPGIDFISIFFGLILLVFVIGTPFGCLYWYKKKYLERCYKAIQYGTSFEDAKPIFKYFEKNTSISSNENNETLVVIKIKHDFFKNTDYEKKVFYYKNGLLVDKDQGYRRTYMSHR